MSCYDVEVTTYVSSRWCARCSSRRGARAGQERAASAAARAQSPRAACSSSACAPARGPSPLSAHRAAASPLPRHAHSTPLPNKKVSFSMSSYFELMHYNSMRDDIIYNRTYHRIGSSSICRASSKAQTVATSLNRVYTRIADKKTQIINNLNALAYDCKRQATFANASHQRL
jgi:hypothetical protein